MTEAEAREHGIPIMSEPPPTTRCRYCGKELPPEGIVLCGSLLFWNPNPPECDCPEAIINRETTAREQREKQEREAKEKRQREWNERISTLRDESGIKKRFLERTFSNYKRATREQVRCYAEAKRYAENFPQHFSRGEGLYIEGTNGTGKTHLAVAIALELLEKGTPVIFKTASDLLADIKKTYDDGGEEESKVMSLFKTVDLLIIDDLGKERCTDWSISLLFSLINDRYEEMRPTIITTNYNADQLIDALTPKGYDNTKATAIVSRLKEVSSVITMAWEDYRGGN